MIYAFIIAFFFAVIIALILIHRSNKKIENHYRTEIQKHINHLSKLTK